MMIMATMTCMLHIYVHLVATVWRKFLTVENIDEFDEFPAIRQSKFSI